MTVCAIIVSYHPTAEIIANVIALIDQVDEIVVIDNASGTNTQTLLSELSRYPTVRIIYNEENLGIAAALNIGVHHAKAEEFAWVITFDQDSQATPDMVKTMLRVYDTYPDKNKVASLSPRYKNQSTGQIATSQSRPMRDEAPYAEVRAVMTSGNLLKLSIFDEIGYFNETLFIDHVDTEFCLRCVQQGYTILEVRDAILLHCIGFPAQHKILWAIKTTTNHTSLRRYYITRNSIYIYKKFAFVFPNWVLHDAVKLVKLMIMLVLFETDRKRKLAAIFRGMIHGLSGRMGKLNEPS